MNKKRGLKIPNLSLVGSVDYQQILMNEIMNTDLHIKNHNIHGEYSYESLENYGSHDNSPLSAKSPG